jgi:DNA repair exonuclease SbcCD ATPase subunit
LDESFNGQGNVTKEANMEVLREYAQEKLVVVIDHNSEFKEMFTQFIDVVYKDGRSEIA